MTSIRRWKQSGNGNTVRVSKNPSPLESFPFWGRHSFSGYIALLVSFWYRSANPKATPHSEWLPLRHDIVLMVDGRVRRIQNIKKGSDDDVVYFFEHVPRWNGTVQTSKRVSHVCCIFPVGVNLFLVRKLQTGPFPPLPVVPGRKDSR